MPLGEGVGSTFDLAYAPPQDVGRVTILFIAGYNAAFTSDALRHIEMKPILLAGAGHGQLLLTG